MDRKWVAAVAAVSGIGLVTLTGCDGSAEAETAASMAEQVLMDRIAIEDMVTRYYANFGKQDSADDFGAFYTEDAVFDVNGVVAQGREAIEGFYTDTGDDEEAPSRQGTFHMMISNPVIDVNGDTATAEFMWTGVMNTAIGERPQLWEQGREYDLLVKQDGQWRIKKRTVIADSGLPDRYKATYQPRLDYKIAAD
jgi:ketosteroid isomerase-like protein